jgi:hypothetical protein
MPGCVRQAKDGANELEFYYCRLKGKPLTGLFLKEHYGVIFA